MAPSSKATHKANGPKRYLPTQTKDSIPSKPLFDPEPSDDEVGALQSTNGAPERNWEESDVEESESEAEDESSDDQSVEVVTKKKEKPTLPKDAEEEELERMIFGDSAGFKKDLDNFALARGESPDDESETEQQDGEDYEDVADQDLFFFDAGPTAQPAGSLALTKADESEDEDDKPAWDDSDDERLVVSLASVPQLRKLRDTEEDDMINGKEYVRRLRRQYERLYPAPDWAIQANGKPKRKRRQTENEDDGSDMERESASDMDMDDEDLSTLPLARLLKDADILSRTSRSSVKRRKLQAGTVEIARLKDVAGAGPVGIPARIQSELANMIFKVGYYVLVVPSYIPPPLVIRSQLDCFAPSPKPVGRAQSEPTSHFTTHQTHSAHDHSLSPLVLGLAYFPQCTETILPCVGHCYRDSRKGFSRVRPST